MILETAAIVSAAKPLVEPFVKEFVASKLKDFTKWCKEKGKEVAIPKSEHFKVYLERMYDKCNVVKTMAFSNSQLSIKDVYVPLTIKRNNWMLDSNDSTVINGVPKKLIKKYKKILITDTAGMGKSTVLKRIFVDLIDNVQENFGIPIYIELNKLHKGHFIVDEIREELKALFEKDYNEMFLGFIQTGGFVFFLDGYDEIASDKALVTNDIQTFISKAGRNNCYFLTSRPDSSLYSFGDFQSFSIEPLKRKEAFELLKKYDLSENKEVSGSLIAQLKSGKYCSIEEYLGNPLLVSLLFTAYNYRQIVPLKKCNFYRQVYVALYEAHKAAQGVKPHQKYSLLEIDDFEKVLRYIGYECLIQNGVRFEEDIILNSIERAKAFYGNLEFGNSAFLKDLWTTVPLFIKEGAEYSWAHKSLMEYFAARFINVDAKENQDNILTAIFESANVSKYGNMLDIYYDFDYKGFSKNITLPLCEKYVEFYDSFRIEAPMIDEESIDLRKSLQFLGDYGVEYGIDDPLQYGGISLMFSAHMSHVSLLRGMDNWIDFCYTLFEAKGRSLLNIDGALIHKKEDELYDELRYLLSKSKIEVGGIKKEVHLVEKDKSFFGDNCIMVRDKLWGEDVLLKVNDGQIVVDKALKTIHGGMSIGSHTGENHPLLFKAINVSMLHCLKRDSLFKSLTMDYKACKKEIENIRGFLPKNSSNTIPLPS